MLPAPLAELAPGVLDPRVASLARELAQDIRPANEVLAEYGYPDGASDPGWLALATSRDFQRLLEEATREWNSAGSTKQRLRLKAQAALEMQLPTLHGIVMDGRADHADRINAAKLLKGIAGIEDTPGGGGSGEGSGVTVKIVIGQESMVKTVSAGPTVIEHDAEHTA